MIYESRRSISNIRQLYGRISKKNNHSTCDSSAKPSTKFINICSTLVFYFIISGSCNRYGRLSDIRVDVRACWSLGKSRMNVFFNLSAASQIFCPRKKINFFYLTAGVETSEDWACGRSDFFLSSSVLSMGVRRQRSGREILFIW